jgi:C4-dicarboxylate-specific signal transduction histidine kinase
MLEGLPVAVFSGEVQADGNFLVDYISPGVARITGSPPEAFRGLDDFADQAAPHASRLLRDTMRHVLTAGTATLDFPRRHADGSPSWLRLRARVTERKAEGAAALIAGTLSDVTDEQRMAEQAANAAKLATLGEMATGLAHELNQPLAIITLAAENTLRGLTRNDPARLPDLLTRLERIIQQAIRARTIVDHLRIFGRDDTGDLVALHIQDAIEGAKILVGGLLRESGILLEVDLPPNLPAVRARLVPAEHVIVNLLVNARDAIREAGRSSGKVSLSAEVAGDRVLVRIRDSGPGFPPDLLPRIFEPFFTTKEVGKGTGLGLSICHGTMRSFGGTIEAANHPGGGAEICLYFRIAPEDGTPHSATAGDTRST